MRSARIICLLISLLQFIFFLKLIEYVRGEEVPPSQQFHQLLRKNGESLDTVAHRENEGRGLFLAPNMKKKRRPGKKSEDSDRIANPTGGAGDVKVPQSENSRGDFQQLNLTKLNEVEGYQEQARGCPACENNECQVTKPIAAGFPVVPFIIAVFTAVAWFVLFLIFWQFFIRPQDIHKHKYQGIGAGGHDQGYVEGYSGYDPPQSMYGPGDEEDDKGSIFEHFLKPHERSFAYYSQTLINILDAIGKLSDFYKDN